MSLFEICHARSAAMRFISHRPPMPGMLACQWLRLLGLMRLCCSRLVHFVRRLRRATGVIDTPAADDARPATACVSICFLRGADYGEAAPGSFILGRWLSSETCSAIFSACLALYILPFYRPVDTVSIIFASMLLADGLRGQEVSRLLARLPRLFSCRLQPEATLHATAWLSAATPRQEGGDVADARWPISRACPAADDFRGVLVDCLKY